MAGPPIERIRSQPRPINRCPAETSIISSLAGVSSLVLSDHRTRKKGYWQSSQSSQIIIFWESYCGFESCLLAANMLRPSEQLSNMTSRFAAKSASHNKFSQWFEPAANQTINTRSSKNIQKYKTVPARTARYGKSPISYLTRILNNKTHK